MFSPVAYLHYKEAGAEAPTLPPGKAYAYILAGNGLFKLASGRNLEALIPVRFCRVAGLPTLTPYVRLRDGLRLRGELLGKLLADARREAWKEPREAMYHIALTEEGRVQVERPEQDTSAGNVSYRGGDDPAIFCDLHSHHEMAACYSGTDNRDELGFRLYGVMGRIFTRPQLRLRVGIYGDHFEIPASWIFTDAGPFTDVWGKECGA